MTQVKGGAIYDSIIEVPQQEPIWAFKCEVNSHKNALLYHQKPIMGILRKRRYEYEFVPFKENSTELNEKRAVNGRTRLYATTEQAAIEGYNIQIENCISMITIETNEIISKLESYKM